MRRPKRQPSFLVVPRAELSGPWQRGLLILAWIALTWDSPRRICASAWRTPQQWVGRRWSD
eukprot:9604721-Alexandrium_andersonii.AAC.1